MNKDNNIIEETEQFPFLPLRGVVVFPGMLLHFDIGKKKSVDTINKAMEEDQTVFLCCQSNSQVSEPAFEDLFSVGVIAKIVQVFKNSDNMARVIVEGHQRAYIHKLINQKSYCVAEVSRIHEEKIEKSLERTAKMRSIKNIFEQYVSLSPRLPADILFKVALCENPNELADFIAGSIFLDFKVKQYILEKCYTDERLDAIIEVLNNEMFLMRLEVEIGEKTRQKLDKSQREYFLREQLKLIREELGENDIDNNEASEYRNKIEKLKLPKATAKILHSECDKLDKMIPGNHEASVIKTYLDTCLGMPWHKFTKEEINIEKIRKQLDKNHFGLKKVKELIIEYLAVKKLAPNTKGQIICLVGPPGVGKTSIAQSIAPAINRKIQRISLGGVRDEAEIRGHRKTYIGSMPGRIISAIKKSGSSNPLIILDEIDKLGNDYKGDPASALLEVLDSEQNHSFVDHYLDIPFDLSKVMFITTANNINDVPPALRDRMEVIEIESYTQEEKFNIARKHLIPKQVKNCGLSVKNFRMNNVTVHTLINNYTKEAGVRNLERVIASVVRKSALKIIEQVEETVKITENCLEELLGPKKYIKSNKNTKNEIGVVNGLAWTAVGGEILPIEVAVMSGTGKVELTGSLGDVMKESAKTAITCIRSQAKNLKVSSDFYKSYDIHIHAPEGAVPKDGPSAGITMAAAIYSALSLHPVKHNVAMTGEITLRGHVLPIGGLKEKTMAAYKAGIDTVLIPKGNFPDLAEIDEAVKQNIKFYPVETINEVLELAVIE